MDHKEEGVQCEAIVAYSTYKIGICIIIIIIKIPIIRR